LTFTISAFLPRARLRARWLETFGKKPSAAFGRELLALGIAYEVQEKRLGGLSKSRAREIDRLIEHAPVTPHGERRTPTVSITRPGTVLVREWQGTTHQVTVMSDGYGWNGQHYSSLSRIAQAITGRNGTVLVSLDYGRLPMESERRILRCVIYTRKSSEHGLEQEFNSLHAQREAGEAYVKSQAHEGWKLLKAPY